MLAVFPAFWMKISPLVDLMRTAAPLSSAIFASFASHSFFSASTAFCSVSSSFFSSSICRVALRSDRESLFSFSFSFFFDSKSAPLLFLIQSHCPHMKFIVPTFEKRGVTSSPN